MENEKKFEQSFESAVDFTKEMDITLEDAINGPTPPKLQDTVAFMLSKDYKARFQAEYFQTAIRYYKLKKMLKDWNEGKLNFTPTCSKQMYRRQLLGMEMYLDVLKERAQLEGVDISIDACMMMQVTTGAQDILNGKVYSVEEVFADLEAKVNKINEPGYKVGAGSVPIFDPKTDKVSDEAIKMMDEARAKLFEDTKDNDNK
jgi:hypothetical protein